MFHINSDVFSRLTYLNGILYVPQDTEHNYRVAERWKEFYWIEEGVPAGIELPKNDASDAPAISIEARDGVITVKGKRPQDLVSVYNSQGAPVGVTTDDTITLLQHGVFIVRIGNVTYKIML